MARSAEAVKGHGQAQLGQPFGGEAGGFGGADFFHEIGRGAHFGGGLGDQGPVDSLRARRG